MCGFLFLLNNFPLQSLEYATYSSVQLIRTVERRARVELSSSVLLQTLGKLKSLQGTELSVVAVICFRIVLNFNFELKVLTDRNKRGEML